MPSLVFRISSVLLILVCTPAARGQFRVKPYLQNPTDNAITVLWFSEDATPGTLRVEGLGEFRSAPENVDSLAYHEAELPRLLQLRLAAGAEVLERLLADGIDPGVPYKHRIRVDGLEPGREYSYQVIQDEVTFSAAFRTPPTGAQPLRFIVYADCETEPESSGARSRWPEPFGAKQRNYLADQTTGYLENLRVMGSRQPHFIAIAGDLVESGGEQRDWDEFWRHNAGEYGELAGALPLLPALGNHEVYGGPRALGRFDGRGRAVAKFREYFETPPNGSPTDANHSRYYRVDYGPVTYITLDSTNGLPEESEQDTNFRLNAKDDDSASPPDFNPGSEQYIWLEKQLAEAQFTSKFIFVQFHHSPYSVGPHGLPPGREEGQNDQSGVPMRVLTPLFKQYGVAAVFSGHCEMYEHSLVDGVHFFDVGVGGDGLRGPNLGKDAYNEHAREFSNEHQVFLAHLDAPERWEGNRLIDGGKHYGHIEVNVFVGDDGFWNAELVPVYVFPIIDEGGDITAWQRRVYDDVLVLTGPEAETPEPLTLVLYGAIGVGCVVVALIIALLLRRRLPAVRTADP